MYRIFLRNDPIIISLAERYKLTTTQVVFAWHLYRNTIILSTNKIRRGRRRVSRCVIPAVQVTFFFVF